MANAMLITEEGSSHSPIFYHQNTQQTFPAEELSFFTHSGYDYREVAMFRHILPINLEPGVDNTIVLDNLFSQRTYASQTVQLTHPDFPEVMVLPVYTWRLVGLDGAGGLSSVDETVMKWAFDRASNFVPDGLSYNYWARERPDAIWARCGIQFRHMGHADVPVPSCWVAGVVAANGNSCGGSAVARDSYCNPSKSEYQDFWDCTEQAINQCTFRGFVDYTKNYRPEVRIFEPNALNIYFTVSFDYTNAHVYGLGCRYGNMAIINGALEGDRWDGSSQPGRLFAHEIGHVLGLSHSNANSRLMAGEGTYTQPEGYIIQTDDIDRWDCDEARTDNTEIINNRL